VNSSAMLWSYLRASIVTWCNKTERLCYLIYLLVKTVGLHTACDFSSNNLYIQTVYSHCYTNDMKKFPIVGACMTTEYLHSVVCNRSADSGGQLGRNYSSLLYYYAISPLMVLQG
jgi:hypothetical protein